jgi:hypothetical protein
VFDLFVGLACLVEFNACISFCIFVVARRDYLCGYNTSIGVDFFSILLRKFVIFDSLVCRFCMSGL